MESLRQSTRQVKRKVRFAFESESEQENIINRNETVNQPSPKKKTRVIPQVIRLDPELDSVTFMDNYYKSRLFNTRILQAVTYVRRIYEQYLQYNLKKITEPMVDMVLRLNSLYLTNSDIICHYGQVRNFINTCVAFGCKDIDSIIRIVTDSKNQISQTNIFTSINQLPISTPAINAVSIRVDYVQKDLNCLYNVKAQLESRNMDFNTVNCHVVIDFLIRKQKEIQFVIVDILINASTKFPNLIDKSNYINFMSMSQFRIKKTHNELIIELGLM